MTTSLSSGSLRRVRFVTVVNCRVVQQAEAASDAGDADAGDEKPEEEEVVDAEFSEVDDDENEKAS